MATKLTLYVDDELVDGAKKYAKKKGLSLSKVINNFFLLLQDDTPIKKNPKKTPITSSLKGILKNSNVDEKEYKKYLEQKYL